MMRVKLYVFMATVLLKIMGLCHGWGVKLHKKAREALDNEKIRY